MEIWEFILAHWEFFTALLLGGVYIGRSESRSRSNQHRIKELETAVDTKELEFRNCMTDNMGAIRKEIGEMNKNLFHLLGRQEERDKHTD